MPRRWKVPVDGVVDLLQQIQETFLQKHSWPGIGYGLSIAGHALIALLLVLGVGEQIELFPVAAPVEIVMEEPPAAARLGASASLTANGPSRIPAVADVDKRAKAPLAALDVNGIDQPKQPGRDGSDPDSDTVGVPLPVANGELVAGSGTAPSRTVIIGPVGPALPQTTAHTPGDDELTAVAEQTLQCGTMAKQPLRTEQIRGRGRVLGYVPEAQKLALLRKSEALYDLRTHPNYVKTWSVFAVGLDDNPRKFVMMLPSGFTVSVGDVVEFIRGHVDPSNSCQYIPAVAVSKL